MMKRAYIDSSVWINRVEGRPEYRALVDQVFASLRMEGWDFCVSDAVELEVLIKLVRERGDSLIAVYRQTFESIHRLSGFGEAFKDALNIVHGENLKAMDAIHVAFALRYECELFVTTDPHFKNLKALPLHWIDLSQNASL